MSDEGAKYRSVANSLRERLRSHPNGYKLPSVRTMIKRFGVSQHTIIAAIRLLEEEGLVTRRHGSGVYATKSTRPTTVCFCRSQGVEVQHDLREVALRDACAARGWQLVVDRYDARHVDIFTDEIAADGFILPPELLNFHAPLLQRLKRESIPAVMLGRDTSSLQLDFVTGDDAPVIREFTAGLVKMGHRRIAYLDSEPPFYEVKRRVEYFLDVCQTLGVKECPVLHTGAEYGYDSTARADEFLRQYLLGMKPEALPFTAIITGSMAGSIPIPSAFHRAGIRIPEDVSVCCIGSDPRAIYAVPPISNAAPHQEELAEEALSIIEKRLAGDKSPLLFRNVPYRPIWRESVGAPRGT